MSRYVKPGVAERALGVDRRTLFKWSQSGGINCIQPGGEHGQRLYDLNSVTATGAAPSPGTATSEAADEHLGGAGAGAERADYIYARVSTRKQGDDLKTQIASLKERHPDAKVLSDCASGLNFKRKGLKALLELAFKGRVRSVFIAHRDRLCRFAYDLLQHVLERHGAKIVVDAHDPDAAASPELELAEDVLAVVTVFGARLYGRRSAGGRQRKRDAIAALKAAEEGQEGGADAGADGGSDGDGATGGSGADEAESGDEQAPEAD